MLKLIYYAGIRTSYPLGIVNMSINNYFLPILGRANPGKTSCDFFNSWKIWIFGSFSFLKFKFSCQFHFFITKYLLKSEYYCKHSSLNTREYIYFNIWKLHKIHNYHVKYHYFCFLHLLGFLERKC